MKFLWLKSKLPLSKFIMWGLDEPCSHFAIVFDKKLVFHSDMTGLHITWLDSIQRSHEIVFEMDVPMDLEGEENMYQAIISQYHGAMYDFGAFLYLTWRGFLKKFFKRPLPPTNPWASKNRFICDEIIQLLPVELVGEEIKNADLSIRSPYQVWLMIQKFRQ